MADSGRGTFGEWLSERRRALGITRDELAMRADCAGITVEKIERGNRKPSTQVARLLLKALHVPAHQHEVLLKFARGAIGAADLEGALLNSPRPHLTGLPVPLTALLGREREAATAIGIMLKPGVRLLTLTGAGGVGKTRLALRIAEELADDFTDGVYFVPLAPVSDPDLVAFTMAQAAGLSTAGTAKPMETLKRGLRDKRALLLVDNFEHVVEAAPLLSELLAWCPQIEALVTSREPLHLSGERQMVVPPLEVPRPEQYEQRSAGNRGDQPQVLGAFPSVQLFVERAEAISEFGLTSENAVQVAEICARLEGLPLAIELAAARVRQLSLDEMLERLGHRLELLTHGARDLPDRHKTIQATIEWSYGLLSEWEQKLLSRLGVFVGGGTLDAVEAICNAHGEAAGGTSEGIESLSDKNLLRIANGDERGKSAGAKSKAGERRVVMLETIREYALEQLRKRGEEDSIKRLHAEYFLAMAEAARLAWYGEGKAAGHVMLEADHNNMRAALQWALDHNDLEMALRLARALSRFWYECGHVVEGRQWLEVCLTREKASPDQVPLSVLAAARSDREMFVVAQSDLASAEILITESLPLYEVLDDKVSLAIAHSNLGAIAAERDDNLQALRHFEQSLAMWRDIGRIPNVAVLLSNMGYLAIHMRDYARAITLCEESLQIQHELKEKWGAVAALIKLGLALLHQGEHDRAVVPLKEALLIAREGQDKRHMAQALNYLGLVALEVGDYSQATAYYRESLGLYRNLGNTFGIVRTLTGLAGLAGMQGEMAQAARLLGAADNVAAGGASMKLTPLEMAVGRRAAEMAQGQLGEVSYNQVRAEGTAKPVEEVIAVTLSE